MKVRGPGWWRKIYTRLWSDPKFLALPDAVRVFAFYVLTGPQGNRIGIFKFSVASAAEDLAIDTSEARQRLARVCDVFGWHYDQAARVLWLPRWWLYNPPPTQKTFQGFLSDLQDVPETPLLQSFAAHTQDLPEHALKTFREQSASAINRHRIADGID